MAGACGSDLEANLLLPSLLGGKSFPLPDVDLSGDEFKIPDTDFDNPVVALKNEDLTTRAVNGSGTFDAIMQSLGNHIHKEYEQNRITGNDYSKAYVGVTTAALGAAVQYLLGRDQAYWQAVLAQQQAKTAEIAAITARVQLETAKAQLQAMRYATLNAEAEYAVTKLKLATEDAQYCQIKAQTAQVTFTTAAILPLQKDGLEYDNVTKKFTIEQLLPYQKSLLQEQVEVQRAQTMNYRTDGALITGQIGVQKDLYGQQIVSYKRDSETKVAKIFTDAWITQKTIDEGLLAPYNFQNSELDVILARLRQNNGLVPI